jgi:transposase
MLEPTPRRFPNRKRPRRDPTPRFKQEATNQLDFVNGCAELAVPEEHLARKVRDLIGGLDFSAVEAGYSSLGRHGYHPRFVLGPLVYGGLIGIHHSTKLAVALRTDAALRLVAGGHSISAGKLRSFRRNNAELFDKVNLQVLSLAAKDGLLKADELATDSVRLRAHASTKSARSLKRSRERLAELAEQDASELDDEGRARLAVKTQKHESAVAECERTGRTNLVVTSPSAGLLKFPNGASAPGHRATMTAAGVKERFVVDCIIDADSHDFGKLEGAMTRTRAVLESLGVNVERMQVAADAGYWCEKDLRFAAENRGWVDVLISERRESRRGENERGGLFSPDKFLIGIDGKAVCPAGTQMLGPYKDGTATRFEGRGCSSCPLKPKCTTGQRKYLTLNPEHAALREQMLERLSQPGATQRYGKRMATIEPVFSSLQDGMAFRRVSARHEKSVRAEVLLKVLTHNVSRLLAARRYLCVRFWLVIAADETGEDAAQKLFLPTL